MAYYLAEGAIVKGDVTIGEDSGIWYHATVRGDTEKITIGSRTNIQDNAVLHVGAGHALTIGDDVTIGHSAIVHGCTVGNNTLIGMGAIILNGAVIGNNCIIGAGALVTQNMEIPDGSMTDLQTLVVQSVLQMRQMKTKQQRKNSFQQSKEL